MKDMSVIDWIAYILVIIGALNWGLIAINESYNVVAIIADATSPIIGTIVYALVGLSGLWIIYTLFK